MNDSERIERLRDLLLAPAPMTGEFYKYTGGYDTKLQSIRDLYSEELADELEAILK